MKSFINKFKREADDMGGRSWKTLPLMSQPSSIRDASFDSSLRDEFNRETPLLVNRAEYFDLLDARAKYLLCKENKYTEEDMFNIKQKAYQDGWDDAKLDSEENKPL